MSIRLSLFCAPIGLCRTLGLYSAEFGGFGSRPNTTHEQVSANDSGVVLSCVRSSVQGVCRYVRWVGQGLGWVADTGSTLVFLYWLWWWLVLRFVLGLHCFGWVL